nr:azurin [Pseudoxanthomonas wuyuanensis]
MLTLALAGLAPAAFAACSIELEGNDAMKFNLANIDVSKKCTTFEVKLRHTGKMARNVMGHNVVVSRTADMAAINADGIKAGLATEYVKPGDARVIAHSKVIGGGESTSFVIPVGKLNAANGPYSFFCSFPGHAALMKGTVTLKP